ncbi:hypothetical protein Taro_028654 [Colocasia esculenta]|uniref:Uncharacterized protein n=1 Tax=Colocasia esculenta TaxID=4460 RepID=A0A843VXW0_COLES|nr:hypothetical protein [Colocasia esculenta]
MPHVAHLLLVPHEAHLLPVPHEAHLHSVPYEAHVPSVPHEAHLHSVPHEAHFHPVPHVAHLLLVPHATPLHLAPHAAHPPLWPLAARFFLSLLRSIWIPILSQGIASSFFFKSLRPRRIPQSLSAIPSSPFLIRTPKHLGSLNTLHQTLGDDFKSCWGRVEEFLVAGEQEISHTKLFFFPFSSAATCTNRPLEVDQSEMLTGHGECPRAPV